MFDRLVETFCEFDDFWLLPRLRVWLGLGLRRLAEGLLGGKAKAGHRF